MSCCVRKKTNNDPDIIRLNLSIFSYTTLQYGNPARSEILNRAMENLRKKFKKDAGVNMGGFVEVSTGEAYFNSTEKMKKGFRKKNPATLDCLNIICTRLWDEDEYVYHVSTAHLKSEQKTILIYDSWEPNRQKPLHSVNRSILTSFHSHAFDALKVVQCQDYAIQDDTFSCGYHSIFAVVMVLAQRDPSAYKMHLRGTWAVIKAAVEDNGRGLRDMTIDDIVENIAKKKENFQPEQLQYEDLWEETTESEGSSVLAPENPTEAGSTTNTHCSRM